MQKTYLHWYLCRLYYRLDFAQRDYYVTIPLKIGGWEKKLIRERACRWQWRRCRQVSLYMFFISVPFIGRVTSYSRTTHRISRSWSDVWGWRTGYSVHETAFWVDAADIPHYKWRLGWRTANILISWNGVLINAPDILIMKWHFINDATASTRARRTSTNFRY